MLLHRKSAPCHRLRRQLAAISLLCGFCVAVLAMLRDVPAADDDHRFVARFRDGKEVTHHEITDLFEENKQAHIRGQRLFDAGNPIRSLRNTFAPARTPTRGIELANGDILPGEIVSHLPATADTPARFLFALADQAGELPLEPTQFAVRETELRRVWSNNAHSHEFEPGLVVSNDGRRWQARAIRFAAGSVQILTADGISNLIWPDIARLDMPNINAVTALLREGIWSTEPDSIVRVTMSNGAEITFPRPMAKKVDSRIFLARPAWAIAPLTFAFSQVSAYDFRDNRDLPLSLIPLAEVKQPPALQTRPWHRNRTANGGLLRLGEWTHDLGFALHAPLELTFALPKGAEQLRAKLGVPHLAGAGCVKCRIHRDHAGGQLLWESGFIRGGEVPVDLQVNLDNAEKITLVVDMAHKDRPAGADPLDIRDDLLLLDPIITIRESEMPPAHQFFTYWLPALDGWELNQEQAAKYVLREAWVRDRHLCEASLFPKDTIADSPPLELRRQVTVTPQNAHLVVEAARGGDGKYGHFFHVLVDRDLQDASSDGGVKTIAATLVRPDRGDYSLGPFLGRQIELAIEIEPRNNSAREMFGIWINRLDLSPIVENTPKGGKFLVPSVRLESLTPTQIQRDGQPLEITIAAGKTTDDQPLSVCKIPFDSGFAVPANSDLTYDLDPSYSRFVAIIGLAGGREGVGPYSIQLDGEPFWQDSLTEKYNSRSPAQQIDIAIPKGHRTITLKVAGKDSQAAWAQAGFVK